ncbi:MarR family winged helix-turn-helix transcriptional regulator [Streptomyces sp. NPDC001902]
MFLSAARDREPRMIDLAELTRLSASRISRVVDSLTARGWVAKRRHEVDARGSVATLTSGGLERLEAAYPSLLASAAQARHGPRRLRLPLGHGRPVRKRRRAPRLSAGVRRPAAQTRWRKRAVTDHHAGHERPSATMDPGNRLPRHVGRPGRRPPRQRRPRSGG